MGSFLDYVNNQKKTKSTKQGNFGRYVTEKKIGLDTLETDLASASDLVNRVYSGWHSADDMKSSRQTVSAMRDRLTAYRGYANDNSNGQDLTEFNTGMDKLIGAYDTALGDWDALTANYAMYSDADSYKKAADAARELKKIADSEEGKQGWEKYLADIEAKKNTGEKPTVGQTMLQGMGDTSSDSFIGTAINNIINMKRNDTTYREPAQDWTDDERHIFGAYYLESPGKAYQYAAKLNEEKSVAAKNKQKQKVSESATSSFGAGLGHTAGALLAAPTALLDYMDDLTSFAANRPITDTGVLTPFEYSQTVTGSIGSKLNADYGTLNESVPIIGGKGIGDVYGLGTSVAQSGLSAHALGPAGTLVSYFGQGAAAGMDEALSRGATDEQAVLFGTIVGAAEGVSEHIGADRLLKVGDVSSATIKDAFREVFKQAGAEGLEEGFSSVVGELADAFVMQDKSVFNNAVREYTDNGMSEADATKKAFVDSIERIMYDSLGGAVSGGVHASPHIAQTQFENSSIGKQIAKNDRMDTLSGLAQSEGDAYAEYISLLNSGKASNAKAGSLYRQMENAAVRDMDAARLSELGRVFSPKTEEEVKVQKKVATYKVGNDTTDNETGSSIKLQGIRTDDSGNTVLKTSAGEKAIDSVTLNRRDAELVAMAEGMEPSQADLFVSMYSGQDTTTYKDSFDMAYAYGKNAYGVETAIKRRGVLTEAQALKVYKLGISDRTSSQQKQIDAITEKHFAEGGKVVEGKFDDTGVDYTKLNSRQKAAASFAKMFSGATGVNVVLFESTADENGVRKAENGRYESGTNTIYMDVYAGFMESAGVVEDAMIPTLSHELTHWMKEKAPEAYANLSGIVMDTLSQHHKAAPEVLVAAEKKRHKDNGRDVSDEYAQDELIARACEDMLSGNKTAAEIIEKMDAETAKTFSEKFKEVVAKIRAWLKDLLKVYKSNSEEAKILRQYDSKLAELQKAWDEAFAKAVRSNQALQNSKTEDAGVAESRRKYSDRNLFLTSDDIPGYLKAGSRRNIKRIKRYEAGEKIIISNEAELRDFVSKSISGEITGKTVAYGIVSKKLADAVYKESSGKVDVRGYYLELVADDINHSFKEHQEAKKADNLPLSEEDFVTAILRVNSSKLVNVEYHADNSRAIKLCLEGADGNTMLIEVVSVSAGSIKLKTVWKETKRNSANAAGNRNSNPNSKLGSARDASVSKDSIPQNAGNIKENVQFSERNAAENVKTVEEYFGRTFNVNEAGYILTNGHLLDMSGKHEGAPGGYRTVDHRDITDALGGDYGGDDYSGAMIQFMREGNIRISPEGGGINLSVMPKVSQMEVLSRYVSKFRGEVVLDIDDLNGNTIVSVEYPKYTHANTVIKDITDYFEKGKVPEAFKVAYSDRDAAKLDSDYLKAVQNGDMDTAQKMVDEAAKRAGYSYSGYHGTKSDFTVFDKNKIRSGATLFASQGNGFYFTENESVARKYAGDGKVLSSYLNMAKPFEFVDKNDSEANRLLNEFAVQHGRGFKVSDYSDYVNFEKRTGSVLSGVVKGDGESFTAFLQEKGYDGIIYTSYNYDTQKADMTYVVFDSSQIKSAEAVTYDDNGNVIPLSQRFNAANEDIRYSERGASLTIDRIDKDLRYYGASDERYAQGYFTSIHPRDFLSLTIRDEVLERWEEAVGTDSELYPLDVDKLRNQEQTPYLIVDTETGEVVGHEGRHRMRALLAEGVTSVPIIVIDRNTKYSKKKEYAMVLTSQDYGHGPVNNGAVATVKNLIPTNAKYRDEIIAYYGGESAVQYSERQTESIYDAVGELKRIQRENDKLKADIERLRKKNRLERTVTGGRELNESHIAAVAGRVLKLADSRYSRTDLASELKGIYEYLQGEDVAWDVFMSKATDLAQRVVAEARERKVTDDYAKMILSTIRSARISLNDTQKTEAEYAYGKNWNRSFFGRVTIANDGIPLESVWSEWATMYPDVFNADISDADMVTALLDIYDSTRTASEVVETYDKSEAARALAFEIYNQFWNVAPVRTLADKHDKEVKRLKFEHRQEMKELRERTDKKVFETQWHYSKLIHEVREARDEKIAQLKKESHEYTKQYREKIERRNQISQITKKSLKLNTWLKKNSKDEHIVEELKAPVAAVLRALDFSSERFLGTGVPTQKDISLKSAFEHLYKSIYDIDKRQGEDDYSIDMPVDYVEFLESMKDQVNGIVERVGDNEHVLRDMTLEQLQDMNKMLSVLTHIVTSANKALADANGKAISTMAQSTMLYANSLGAKSTKVGNISDFFNFDNALPVYTFKMMGEGGQQIFRNMQDGWDKMAFHVKQIIDYSKAAYDKTEVREWSKEVHEFTFSDGSKVKMTTAQIMSLYCLQKRDQARRHLLRGGIRVSDFKVGSDTISNPKGVLLLPHEIEKVVSKLSARQKAVADSLQSFMNTVCSEWGNEVSMRRFGIKSFGEENYFPIQSDANVTGRENPQSRSNSEMFRLLNMDFTKPLNENASNRIIVDNIFDVFATHTSDMAKYNALALPILDMFRWYNYKESHRINPKDPEDLRKDENTLRECLDFAYGKGAQRYIAQFIKDINGAHSGGVSSGESFAKKMTSNYKVAAVGANLRVALLQPTAYARASVVLDPKYLAKGLTKLPQIEKAKETCGIALWKSLGFYDTNISRGITDQIKHEETWVDWTRDKAMKLAEWGDSITWGLLYNACEAEVNDNLPGLSGKAKDAAIAERLREVIYMTQVVDSTMTRTQMMRSKSFGSQMLTSFMSEPMMSYNILHDCYIQYNADKRFSGSTATALKRNGKKIVRATMAYLITSLAAAMAGGAADYFRDDDEEKDAETYFVNVKDNMLSDIFGMLPLMRDVYSGIQGYSPTRMDEAFITSTISAIKKIFKSVENGEWDYKTTYSVTKAFSQITGLPLGSLLRDVIAIWNSTVGEVYGSVKVK